jgi:hypothetical protein
MKTFLEHCQGVCREAGIAGGEQALTSVLSQTGQIGRIVNNVRQVWIELQNKHFSAGLYWRWMRSDFTLTTVASQGQYAYGDAAIIDVFTGAAITRWRNWMFKDDDIPAKRYLTASGAGTEGWLIYMDYDDYRTIYEIGTQTEGPPAHITITPQNKIALGPIPDDIYTINGVYMKGAQSFAANSDVPELPESFEDVIMWKALSRHGLQKNASEIITLGEDGAATYMGDLEGDQLSEIAIGGPLA